MLQKMQAFIKEKGLIKKGDKIVLGLSGGADSVCLLVALQEVFKNEITLLAVHVNHLIRGEEAKRDEDFVKKLCKKRGVELIVSKKDVPKIAKERGMSLEEAGRLVRYQVFYEELEKRSYDKIAVAHNKEDVAETFLLHLARGSALSGLTGIKETQGVVIRPLLKIEKREILIYLEERGEDYVTDSSNLGLDYTRNVIRHSILPAFQSKVNERVVSHIEETIGFLREADDFIKAEAKNRGAVFLQRRKGCLYIDNGVLELPPLLVKEIVYDSLCNMAESKKDIGLLHVNLVVALFQKEVGKSLDLPYSIRASRNYQGIRLSKRKESPLFLDFPRLETEICEIRDIESLRKEGYNIELTLKSGEVKKLSQNGCVRWFDYDKITETLELRTRKEGDYITISEDGKKKKLKAYFIDEKVPREERGLIPLLAMGSEILWVFGGRMGEGARIGYQTKRLLRVKINKMEDEIK